VTPEIRTLRARAAAYSQWAATDDWSERTAGARAAFLSRFERQVDPDGRLDPADRARRAEAAKRAYFAKLAMKSAKARAKKKGTGHAVA